MCVICYKPVGKNLPSKKKIKTMFNNNPDGAGLMYSDGERVIIKKGFMTLGAFNSALSDIRDRASDIPIVMHFRITTHGGTSAGMTHPFPVTDDVKKLAELEIETGLGVAHNGIISMTSYAKALSDTAEYVRRYMTKLLRDGVDADILDIIEESIGSKMCILERDMSAHLLGDFIQDGNGVFYSNDSYKPASKRGTKKTSWSYTPSYWSNYDRWSYVDDALTTDTERDFIRDCEDADGACDLCKRERECYGDWTEYNPYAPERYNASWSATELGA